MFEERPRTSRADELSAVDEFDADAVLSARLQRSKPLTFPT
jgi:hypothetical protein